MVLRATCQIDKLKGLGDAHARDSHGRIRDGTTVKNTVVRQSEVHGRGLFASRDFAPGEVVEAIEGEIVLGLRDSKYAIRLRGRRSLILTNKVKYINHGNPANVVISLRKQAVIAIAPIHAGDELLSGYDSVFGGK